MTSAMFTSVAPAARFALARPMMSTAVLNPALLNLHPIAVAPPLPSLPLASSRDGSLFVDRADSTLHWYLPDFVLAGDVDPLFAFAASQSGQQANGQPFDVARLALTVVKQQPAQVAQFASANPGATLTEIPLDSLSAVLTSAYTDQSGTVQQRAFTASAVQDQGDGSFLLVFDGSILGDAVLAVYQDLQTFGKAAIAVSGYYQSWAPPAAPLQFFHGPILATVAQHPMVMSPLLFHPPQQIGPAAPPPSPPPLVQARLPFSETLPLGLKYNVAGYQLRYTVTTASTPSHVILGAGDLSGFGQRQTQFEELVELGDIGAKYPTLSRAYIGVISKTIVLIPRTYAIVRAKSGCLATCLARVDSSPSSTSQCAFEFTFIVGPAVSHIEMSQLAGEIANHPGLGGYQITFADLLQTTPASTVLTAFASHVQFAAGINPHSFALTITVQDDGVNAPAVADANILIAQISARSGTDLIGSLSLMLDDGYPNPVLAAIDLNFAHTLGSDEVLAQIDQNAGVINVTNQSPLDLQMQNYALVQGFTVTPVAAPLMIPAGGSVTFPLPADSGAGLAFVYEAQLALPATMDPSAVARFLNFQTVNVQDTRYVVALDASGVDFTRIASLACAVTFPSLPSVAVWQTTLTANLKSDNTHVQIPIQNAIFTLPATINVTIDPADPNAQAYALTVQNDFTANPVMVLMQSQMAIPPSPPPPPASTTDPSPQSPPPAATN